MRIDTTHATTVNLIMTRMNNVLFGPKKKKKKPSSGFIFSTKSSKPLDTCRCLHCR